MKTRLLYILTILCMAAAMSACHSSRQQLTTKASNASAEKLFDKLTGDYKPWTDLYVPVNMALRAPIDMSVSGRATLIRDSQVNISFRLLGMEVAYINVDTTEVYIVDKYHKMYYSERLDKLPADFKLTVGNLQDMLLGRAFAPGQPTLKPTDAADFVLSSANDTFTLTPVKTLRGVNWFFTASSTNPPLLTALDVTIKNGLQVACSYAGQVQSEAGVVASSISLASTIDNKDVMLEIGWDMNDAKWNTGRTVKFSPPGNNYKRINLESLLKSF